MDQEWSWPYFQENYTGPWLSNGEFQASVAYGKVEPNSRLDALSRDHDTAYALSKTAGARRKADRVYYRKTRDMSWFPRLAGNIVLYGNDPLSFLGMGYHSDSSSSSSGGGGINMGNAKSSVDQINGDDPNFLSKLQVRKNLRGELDANVVAQPVASAPVCEQPGRFTPLGDSFAYVASGRNEVNPPPQNQPSTYNADGSTGFNSASGFVLNRPVAFMSGKTLRRRKLMRVRLG